MMFHSVFKISFFHVLFFIRGLLFKLMNYWSGEQFASILKNLKTWHVFFNVQFLWRYWYFDLCFWDTISHCLSWVPRLSYDVKYLGQAACRMEDFLPVSGVGDPDVSEVLVLHHVTSLHVHKHKRQAQINTFTHRRTCTATHRCTYTHVQTQYTIWTYNSTIQENKSVIYYTVCLPLRSHTQYFHIKDTILTHDK